MKQNATITNCPLLLIYSSTRILLQVYDELLEEFELTYTQYLVLLCIYEKQVCSITDVGEVLSLDSGTLSPLIKKLEGRGLVKRARSFDDERKLSIVLTNQGSTLIDKTHKVNLAVSQELSLKDHEIRILTDILQSLKTNKTKRKKLKAVQSSLSL